MLEWVEEYLGLNIISEQEGAANSYEVDASAVPHIAPFSEEFRASVSNTFVLREVPLRVDITPVEHIDGSELVGNVFQVDQPPQ